MSPAIVDLSHHDLEKWDLKKAAQILRGIVNISLFFIDAVLLHILLTK